MLSLAEDPVGDDLAFEGVSYAEVDAGLLHGKPHFAKVMHFGDANGKIDVIGSVLEGERICSPRRKVRAYSDDRINIRITSYYHNNPRVRCQQNQISMQYSRIRYNYSSCILADHARLNSRNLLPAGFATVMQSKSCQQLTD